MRRRTAIALCCAGLLSTRAFAGEGTKAPACCAKKGAQAATAKTGKLRCSLTGQEVEKCCCEAREGGKMYCTLAKKDVAKCCCTEVKAEEKQLRSGSLTWASPDDQEDDSGQDCEQQQEDQQAPAVHHPHHSVHHLGPPTVTVSASSQRLCTRSPVASPFSTSGPGTRYCIFMAAINPGISSWSSVTERRSAPTSVMAPRISYSPAVLGDANGELATSGRDEGVLPAMARAIQRVNVPRMRRVRSGAKRSI